MSRCPERSEIADQREVDGGGVLAGGVCSGIDVIAHLLIQHDFHIAEVFHRLPVPQYRHIDIPPVLVIRKRLGPGELGGILQIIRVIT